jgi:hypothetical protein
MLFLIGDILSDALHERFTYRHGEVFILALESSATQPVFVYPERGLAFYQLHYLFNRLIRPQRNQTVNVVNVTADEIEKNILPLSILPNVLENPLPYLFRQKRLTILG